MRKIGENGPVDLYHEYGDTLPPVDKLSTLYERTLAEPHHPKTSLNLAHMCLDLAVVYEEQSEQWLDSADEHLQDTVVTTRDMQHHGYTIDATSAVQSIFRRTELPRWRAAVCGINPAPTDYIDMLSALEQALPYTKEPDGSESPSVSAVLEYLPLALGARAHTYFGGGWYGRLALTREDMRPLRMRSQRNPNWDNGVQDNASADQFLNPQHKIQIKNKPASHEIQSYARGGVKLISAVEYGFADYEQLIAHLYRELDRQTSEDSGPSPLTSSLNVTSRKLRQAIFAPIQKPYWSKIVSWR